MERNTLHCLVTCCRDRSTCARAEFRASARLPWRHHRGPLGYCPLRRVSIHVAVRRSAYAACSFGRVCVSTLERASPLPEHLMAILFDARRRPPPVAAFYDGGAGIHHSITERTVMSIVLLRSAKLCVDRLRHGAGPDPGRPCAWCGRQLATACKVCYRRMPWVSWSCSPNERLPRRRSA